MKILTKEVKIAIVAIVGVAVLFFGMNFLKGLTMFSSESDYYIEFDDISGLSSTSPVYVGGCKVGVVKGIEYDFNKSPLIKTLVAIEKDMRIPEDSHASIESDMLGNVKVNLKLGTSTEIVPIGGTISGAMDNGALGQLSAMVPAIEQILPKLDSIMGSLNAILADPALTQSLHNVENITSNLTTTTTELNTLMAGLNKDVPGMLDKTDALLADAGKVSADLASIDIQNTMLQVDKAIANIEQLTTRLNSNEGSLGLLMNDPTLYNNLASTMEHADSLLVNFREHPKRYVHFSLFGKKDN